MTPAQLIEDWECEIAKVKSDPILGTKPVHSRRLLMEGMIIELLNRECPFDVAVRIIRRCRALGYAHMTHRLTCEGWFIRTLRENGHESRARALRTRVTKLFERYCKEAGATSAYRKQMLGWLNLPPRPLNPLTQ